MPHVQAANVQTYYQSIGKGKTAILLHGWANSWEAWSPIIPELSEMHTLIIPDLPGFGKSDTPKMVWNTDDYAKWLSSFIQALHIQKFSLIGHSYGGKISVLFCSRRTEPQPSKLVLIGASGIMNTLSPQKKTISTLTKLMPRFVKDMLPDSIIHTFYEKIVGETDYAYANTFQKAVLRKILAEDFGEEMKHIQVPTLILWGEHDSSSPTEKAEIFHSNIPSSTLHIIKNTGHFPHHEKPQEVLHEIKGFIQ